VKIRTGKAEEWRYTDKNFWTSKRKDNTADATLLPEGILIVKKGWEKHSTKYYVLGIKY